MPIDPPPRPPDRHDAAAEPFPKFRGRVRQLLADLEADREELELAITDGAARRMLLRAHGGGEPAADHRLRAEADELDRLIEGLRHALDAERRSTP